MLFQELVVEVERLLDEEILQNRQLERDCSRGKERSEGCLEALLRPSAGNARRHSECVHCWQDGGADGCRRLSPDPFGRTLPAVRPWHCWRFWRGGYFRVSAGQLLDLRREDVAVTSFAWWALADQALAS
jgi:hypothetical protein